MQKAHYSSISRKTQFDSQLYYLDLVHFSALARYTDLGWMLIELFLFLEIIAWIFVYKFILSLQNKFTEFSK